MGIEPTQDASQRPANGFEDRGRHQPPNIPQTKEMLFGQRNADALDPEWLRMASQHADKESQHPIHRRAACDRGHQGRLWRAKSSQLAFLGGTCEASRPRLDEGDSNAGIPFAGMDEGQRLLTAQLPGPDLLPFDPPLQRAQETFPVRVLAGVDRNLHG